MMHDEPAPSADTSTPPPTEDPAAQKSTGQSFFESLNALGTAASNFLNSGADLVLERYEAVEAAVTNAAKTTYNEGVNLFVRSLTGVAADPKDGPGVVEELVRLAPVVGTTKMYSDAWLKYHTGKAENNAEMVTEARRECAVAVISAGLDVTTLGLSGVARSGLKLVLTGVTGLHVFASLSSAQKKLINPMIDSVLENQRVSSGIESMLNLVQPLKKEEQKPAEPVQ